MTTITRENAAAAFDFVVKAWDKSTDIDAPPWFTREMRAYQNVDMDITHQGGVVCLPLSPYHRAVMTAIATFGLPADPKALMLEVPHAPVGGDTLKVAFTRTPEHGEADRQTVVSLSKYLARWWPEVPSHNMRDFTGRFTPNQLVLWDTLEGIVRSIEDGPSSCMKSTYHANNAYPFWPQRPAFNAWIASTLAQQPQDATQDLSDAVAWDHHPYAVYAPTRGWAAAVRLDADGHVLGRCMVHKTTQTFVRSYQRSDAASDGAYGSDHMLEDWLQSEGYEKKCIWPHGVTFDRLDHATNHDGPFMMPYLDGSDGDARWVEDCGDRVRKIDDPDDSNHYKCDNTDATLEAYGDEDEDSWTCEDCDEGQSSDESYNTVGSDHDRTVCDSCIQNYAWVRGGSSRWGNYREYYVADDEAQQVVEPVATRYNRDGFTHTSVMVDSNNVPEMYCTLENGEVAEVDNTVTIDDEQYFTTDPRVVELHVEHDGESYALKDDCWQDGDDHWFHDDVEHIMYDGEKWDLESAWQDEVTGWWYPSHVESTTDDETGTLTVHPDYNDRVSRQADFTLTYAQDQAPTQEALPLPELAETPVPYTCASLV